jgi:hypothetical protein
MALLTRPDTATEQVAQRGLMASESNPQKTPRTGPSYTKGRDVTCRGLGPPGRRRSRPHEPEHKRAGRRGGESSSTTAAQRVVQDTVARAFRVCLEAMKSRMTG